MICRAVYGQETTFAEAHNVGLCFPVIEERMARAPATVGGLQHRLGAIIEVLNMDSRRVEGSL